MPDLKTNVNTTRYLHLDFLKFIAMFFVVVYHSTIYQYDIINDAGVISYASYLFRTLLSACVPLFFFTNGYLLLSKKFDLRKHIFKTVRLVVLTVLWGAINLLCMMVIRDEYMTVGEFVNAIVHWKQDWINFLWYMGTLVCIYIFFPLLKLAFDNSKKIFVYFTSVCALMTFGNTFLSQMVSVGLGVLSGHTRSFDMINFFNIFTPFNGFYAYSLVYFCLGGMVKSSEDKIMVVPSAKRNVICSFGILASCVCLWAMGIFFSKGSGEVWDVVWHGYDSVFTLINVILLFVLSKNYTSQNRFIKTVSQNTLGIYFIHSIFITASINFVMKYLVLQNVWFNLVYALAILIISLLVTVVIKKIPVVNNLVK